MYVRNICTQNPASLGQETSLTNATRVILENGYHVAPGPYWTFNGRRLRDIYEETY